MDNKEKGKASKTSKNKFTSLIIGLIIIAIILGSGVWWFIQQSKFITSDDAYVDAYEVTISPQVPGRIVKLLTQEGSHVKKGDLLAQLDSADYVVRMRQAEVNLEQAKINIRLAKVRTAQAKTNYERAQTQYRENIIPKAQFQNEETAYQVAQVELSLAKEKIKVLESSMEAIRVSLSHTNIYAPMDGVVAKRWVLKGDVVSPGQAIFTVFDDQKNWITVMLPENEIRHIHLGDTAQITVDAYPKATFKGVFYQIGNTTASKFSLIPPSNASGNFTKVTQRIPLKLSIFNTGGEKYPKMKLLPGMSAEIKVSIK